jgi:hypothetical protein
MIEMATRHAADAVGRTTEEPVENVGRRVLPLFAFLEGEEVGDALR